MTDTMPQDAPSVTGALPLYADARPVLASGRNWHERAARGETATGVAEDIR